MPEVQSFAARLQVVDGGAPEPTPIAEPSATFDQGYENGLAAGRAQAALEAEEQAAELREKVGVELTRVAEECKFRYQEWLTSLESPLAALSVSIAAKIIGREVSTGSEVVESWVKQALAEVSDETHAKIRVAPFQFSDTPSVVASEKIEIVEDPSITAGCVIETEHGMIDARIESMLAEALTTIREAA